MAKELEWMGFNMVSRANNHSVDWSYGGLLATSKYLDEIGIIHAGVGNNLAEAREPAYLDIKNRRVGLISSASSFPSFGSAGKSRSDMHGRPGLNPMRYSSEIRIQEDSYLQLKKILENVNAKMVIGPLKEDSLVLGRYVGGRHNYVPDRSIDGVRFIKNKNSGVFTKPYEPDLIGNLKSIKNARRQSDLVILSHHGHEDDGTDRHKPATFIEKYARKSIDSGADIFIGHGPHVLRGIEIYKNKPIIYSLGNFFFQGETIKRQGQDAYDRYHLNIESNPADLYDARVKSQETNWKGWKAHAFETKEWDSILAEVIFNEGELDTLALHPVTLGIELPRAQKGTPVTASKKDARRIFDSVSEYSLPYGTELKMENNIIKVIF
jgi:poly-gamma-glutamate synthesis protein (capsule biosynthesis protein)